MLRGLFQPMHLLIILGIALVIIGPGKLPEIDHCDQLVNAHVLSVEAKLDGAQLKLPWDFPILENLKGHLLFQKGLPASGWAYPLRGLI